MLNGISVIPGDRDIVEVVGAGQNPRKAAVPILSDLADVPAGNPVISFLFKLQYADPQELQQVLMAYFQGSTGSINILALPKSSSLLVTQNADIIRQLASVIEQVDVAPAEVVSEFIKLDRADATKVVEMLKDVFEKGSQPSSQPGIRSVRVPPSVPQPMPVESEIGGLGAGLSEEAVVVGKIKLTADVRTNRIHVVTRPINMPFIRKLKTGHPSVEIYLGRRCSSGSGSVFNRARYYSPGRRGRWRESAAAGSAWPHLHPIALHGRNNGHLDHFDRNHAKHFRRTYDAASGHCAQGGHGRQRQANRRSARECDHCARQSRSRGKGRKDSR